MFLKADQKNENRNYGTILKISAWLISIFGVIILIVLAVCILIIIVRRQKGVGGSPEKQITLKLLEPRASFNRAPETGIRHFDRDRIELGPKIGPFLVVTRHTCAFHVTATCILPGNAPHCQLQSSVASKNWE